jgi:hypothetical protein
MCIVIARILCSASISPCLSALFHAANFHAGMKKAASLGAHGFGVQTPDREVLQQKAAGIAPAAGIISEETPYQRTGAIRQGMAATPSAPRRTRMPLSRVLVLSIALFTPFLG